MLSDNLYTMNENVSEIEKAGGALDWRSIRLPSNID